MDDFKEEERQLADFVGDDDSRDTLRWVLGLLQSFLGLTIAAPADFLAHLPV